VQSRLLTLQREETDSFNLIVYQVARELRPDRPEAIVRGPATIEQLMAIAASTPERLAGICNDCAATVGRLKATGRGGSRHGADLADRLVIEALGHYFEWLTNRRPTLSFKEELAVRWRDRYHGPFFLLCRSVFAALGKTISSRQVFDLLRSIDIPRWKLPAERRRPPWNRELRKAQSPH
jgi:hypothetical protein